MGRGPKSSCFYLDTCNLFKQETPGNWTFSSTGPKVVGF